MNPTLIFVREICLAIWFGGLVAIDAIETPIRIHTREVTRQQATAIGGRVFTRFGWIQVALGVISLAASIFISSAQASTLPVTAITVMLLISLIQSFFVAPKMLALRTQLYASGPDPKVKPPGFNAVHGIYMLADVVKTGIAFWLLYRLSCAHCQVGL
jgi:Domain of unknown function (DUF4149)